MYMKSKTKCAQRCISVNADRYTRRLKIVLQLTGVFPPDPELTRPTQALFEQFYRLHGFPNEAESDLLQAVGYVDAETIDAWCKIALIRLRPSGWSRFS